MISTQSNEKFKISVQNHVIVIVDKSTKRILTMSEPNDFINLEDAIREARRNYEQGSYKN